jgi:uncharacterized protein YggE
MITRLLLCLCLANSVSCAANDTILSKYRSISVSGTASVQVPVDVIVWTLVIADSDRDMLAAKRRNDERVRAVIGLRTELGLKAGDVETGQVSIRREFEQDEQGRQGAFKHFTISRAIVVRQRDLEQFDLFLEKFVATAQPDVTFEFQYTRIQDARAETRRKALQAAQEKAAALARVVGAKLGRVLRIDEHLAAPLGGGGGGGGGYSLTLIGDPGFQADVPSSTFVPGQIDERITIYAIFSLK